MRISLNLSFSLMTQTCYTQQKDYSLQSLTVLRLTHCLWHQHSTWSKDYGTYCITWKITEDQPVIVFLTCNTKQVILSISSFPFKVFQVHTQHAVIILSQAVNLVQSKPKFTIQVTKATFVVGPFKVEINRAVQSLLEHSPSSTVRCLVTEYIKGK